MGVCIADDRCNRRSVLPLRGKHPVLVSQFGSGSKSPMRPSCANNPASMDSCVGGGPGAFNALKGLP